MFTSERVSDFMFDAVDDLAVGVVPEGGHQSVWEALRDLVGNLEHGDVDIDELYDREAPSGDGDGVALVFANLWDDEGLIAVVPGAELAPGLRADLERCNGVLFDDQSDDTDWDGFPAALRIAAACGAGGSLDEFRERYRDAHSTDWDQIDAFAQSHLGCLAGYGIYPQDVFDDARLRQPLAACYALGLGAS